MELQTTDLKQLFSNLLLPKVTKTRRELIKHLPHVIARRRHRLHSCDIFRRQRKRRSFAKFCKNIFFSQIGDQQLWRKVAAGVGRAAPRNG
ncbi:MAG: hypothetical protein U1E25_15760 [Methylocystis sp.]